MASTQGQGTYKLLGPIVAAVLLAGGVAAYFQWGAGVSGGSTEEKVRSVRKIAAHKPVRGAEALAKAAASDPSPRVRQEALAGLIPLIEPKYRPVVETGTRDADADVRTVAAEAMGEFNDAQSADVLISLAENDPDESVRLAALRSLADCSDPRATVCLLNAGENGSNRKVKLEAMKSLLRKFKGRLSHDRDPDDGPRWRDLIQRFKWDARVRTAYAAAGVRIIDRPQDILGKDWHPERGELGTADR